jgi:Zn finger protein HypA/HybF involved in hydrogenase expression
MDQATEFDIDEITFDCTCPKCSHETDKSAGFIRQFSQYVCPNCGSIVPIVDRREILKALAVGEKVVELAREIRKPKPAL